MFAEQHQDSVLIDVDRTSFVEQENIKKQRQSKNQDGSAPYDVLLDVLEAIGQDKSNLSSKASKGIFDKAQNLISVIYKYAIAPTVGYTY